MFFESWDVACQEAQVEYAEQDLSAQVGLLNDGTVRVRVRHPAEGLGSALSVAEVIPHVLEAGVEFEVDSFAQIIHRPAGDTLGPRGCEHCFEEGRGDAVVAWGRGGVECSGDSSHRGHVDGIHHVGEEVIVS